MVLPQRLFEAVRKIQDTILICPPVISQFAAVGALNAGREYCKKYLEDLCEVRSFARRELESLGDICAVPQANGAFYFLLKIHEDMDALELTEKLIREHGVAVIPGDTFGMSDGCYLRVAYGALQKETAHEGIGRLAQGLKAILR
jgi:aspartate/methionine/tyrosine aminotransferase